MNAVHSPATHVINLLPVVIYLEPIPAVVMMVSKAMASSLAKVGDLLKI